MRLAVALAALAEPAIAAAALAPEAARKDGLPADVTGYAAWPELKTTPIVGCASRLVFTRR